MMRTGVGVSHPEVIHPEPIHSTPSGGLVERVKGRRQTLYHATLRLEIALGTPCADLPRWRERVLPAAADLAAQIDAHIRESEQPGEFLHSITEKAPHLVHAAQQLEAEHGDLSERAGALVEGLQQLDWRQGRTDASQAAEPLRELALQLMGSLIRHRQRGADLMYLAYNEDLGSSGG